MVLIVIFFMNGKKMFEMIFFQHQLFFTQQEDLVNEKANFPKYLLMEYIWKIPICELLSLHFKHKSDRVKRRKLCMRQAIIQTS